MTVPYVTAAIETEDPFLNHAINGIDMYDFLGNWSLALNPLTGNPEYSTMNTPT